MRAHLIRNAFYLLLLLAGTLIIAVFRHEAKAKAAYRTLTFADRVAYQRAIEEVYWRHRIWPKERTEPKPSLDTVMSQAQLEKKVTDYLRKSQALEDYRQRPITAEQLQAEMDRMAQNTKQPEVLRELFDALGNDPLIIAECLARPALAEQLLRNWYAYDQRIHGELKQCIEAELQADPAVEQMNQLSGRYSEVELIKSDNAEGGDNRDSERSVKLNAGEWNETVQKLATAFGSGAVAAGVSPAKVRQIKTGILSRLQEDETRYYVIAVIAATDERVRLATVFWFKEPLESWLAKSENQAASAMMAPNSRYTLPTIAPSGCIDDTWTATSTTNAPAARCSHNTVWTGSEMIVWGGSDVGGGYLNTGARYDPSTDSWASTSTINAPAARQYHNAGWTGSEMIVWGGVGDSGYLNTGGRYNPATDGWRATRTTNAPTARTSTAVWTDNKMIVCGGVSGSGYLTTGGRYNPATDSWAATSTTNAPMTRSSHTAVWTGSAMIVRGGDNGGDLNKGGKYSPARTTWTATSTTNEPTVRVCSAVWAGSEMIVWGGYNGSYLNTGGRYSPGTDSWVATSITNAPAGRTNHTALWSGTEMIVWGGTNPGDLNTGGR